MEQIKNLTPPWQASGAQAIHRAIKVLRCIARASNEGVSLSALTKQAGLIKSTTHRLTTALIAEGLVEQDNKTRRYYLGAGCHALGLIASNRFGLHKVAAKHVSRLAQETGDTAFFSIRQDTNAVCVLREEGDYPLKSHALLAGDRHPLGVGAGSQAMLAALADSEVDYCIEHNIEYVMATYPKFSRALMVQLVEQARAKGYAVNPGLILAGSLGIGVALRNGQGEVVGALSIATVEGRLEPDREAELYKLLRREAEKLEQSLAASR